jgi:hypothetical protein
MCKLPSVCHSRVGGNPVVIRTPLDSGLRGNDLVSSPLNARRTLSTIVPSGGFIFELRQLGTSSP